MDEAAEVFGVAVLLLIRPSVTNGWCSIGFRALLAVEMLLFADDTPELSSVCLYLILTSQFFSFSPCSEKLYFPQSFFQKEEVVVARIFIKVFFCRLSFRIFQYHCFAHALPGPLVPVLLLQWEMYEALYSQVLGCPTIFSGPFWSVWLRFGRILTRGTSQSVELVCKFEV